MKHLTRRAQPESPLDNQLFASHASFLAERAAGADEDVHMLSHVVDHVIERCTRPGDLVLDPFAGFGTTLERAIALGRGAVGVELLPERVEHVRERVPGAKIIEGDARGLFGVLGAFGSAAIGEAQTVGDVNQFDLFDLILTSPPYMTSHDHEADPLTAYEANGGNYNRYLSELELVAAQCARLLRPGGYLVCNVADISYRGRVTRLIDDVDEVFARHLTRLPRTTIVWDQLPHDLIADALLVLRRPSVAEPRAIE